MNRYLVHESRRHLFELDEAKVGDRVRLAKKYAEVELCEYPPNWQDLRGTLIDIEDAGDGWVYEHVMWDDPSIDKSFLRGCCQPI